MSVSFGVGAVNLQWSCIVKVDFWDTLVSVIIRLVVGRVLKSTH